MFYLNNLYFLKLRTEFYMTMTAVEDEETQRRGLVGVVFKLSSKEEARGGLNVQDRGVKLCDALPARYVGLHYCVKDPEAEQEANRDIGLLDSRTRVRCRIHNGKHLGERT